MVVFTDARQNIEPSAVRLLRRILPILTWDVSAGN